MEIKKVNFDNQAGHCPFRMECLHHVYCCCQLNARRNVEVKVNFYPYQVLFSFQLYQQEFLDLHFIILNIRSK